METTTWMATKGPKTKRLATERLYKLAFIQSMESATGIADFARDEVPEAWETLELDLDVEAPKEKVTLYLDRTVVRMFKGMGKGYQARINRILELWLQLKISQKVQSQRDMADYLMRTVEERRREDPTGRLEKHYEWLRAHEAYEEGVRDAKAGKV